MAIQALEYSHCQSPTIVDAENEQSFFLRNSPQNIASYFAPLLKRLLCWSKDFKNLGYSGQVGAIKKKTFYMYWNCSKLLILAACSDL